MDQQRHQLHNSWGDSNKDNGNANNDNAETTTMTTTTMAAGSDWVNAGMDRTAALHQGSMTRSKHSQGERQCQHLATTCI
jgi:hypothetical protein